MGHVCGGKIRNLKAKHDLMLHFFVLELNQNLSTVGGFFTTKLKILKKIVCRKVQCQNLFWQLGGLHCTGVGFSSHTLDDSVILCFVSFTCLFLMSLLLLNAHFGHQQDFDASVSRVIKLVVKS